VASPISPAMMGGGPPVQPPTEPTMSAIPMGAEGPASGQSAALPQLVFQIEQMIKTVARILPTQSGALDQIVSDLRDVLAMALQGGGAQPAPNVVSPATEQGAIPFGG